MNQQAIKQVLLPALQPLEEERWKIDKKIKHYNRWSGLATVLGIAFMVISMWMTSTLFGGGGATFSSFFVSGAFAALGVYLYREHAGVEVKKLTVDFQQKVKKEAYEAVFRAWNPNIQYVPREQIQESYFEAAALHEGYDNYKGEDYCEGMLKDGRRFQFSEVWAQREVYNSGYGEEYYPAHATVFRGLFFVLENTLPHPNFDGFLKIYPTILEASSMVSRTPVALPQKTSSSKHHEGILDADFDANLTAKPSKSKEPLPALFDRIYTVDDAEGEDELAREQLPLALTEQLGHLKSFFQQQIAVTFCDNKAYFSARHSLDYLQVPVEHSLVSEARINHLVGNFWITFLLLERMAEATLADTPNHS